MQISPEVMHEQVGTIYEQQKDIGYESSFIEGEDDSQRYMEGLFSDWQAQEHHLGAAREKGRLRQQYRVDLWPGRQG